MPARPFKTDEDLITGPAEVHTPIGTGFGLLPFPLVAFSERISVLGWGSILSPTPREDL